MAKKIIMVSWKEILMLIFIFPSPLVMGGYHLGGKSKGEIECIIERGETELPGCSFKNCKLMLKGNAHTVGKIIKLFTGKSSLKVLEMEEPLFER